MTSAWTCNPGAGQIRSASWQHDKSPASPASTADCVHAASLSCSRVNEPWRRRVACSHSSQAPKASRGMKRVNHPSTALSQCHFPTLSCCWNPRWVSNVGDVIWRSGSGLISGGGWSKLQRGLIWDALLVPTVIDGPSVGKGQHGAAP